MIERVKPRTSLWQETVWLAISLTVLVVFVPTAVSTVTTTADWTTGFIDIPAWEAALPTWLTFGVNCVLVLLAAALALASAALLFRRLRTSR